MVNIIRISKCRLLKHIRLWTGRGKALVECKSPFAQRPLYEMPRAYVEYTHFLHSNIGEVCAIYPELGLGVYQGEVVAIRLKVPQTIFGTSG